jgi:hypothetical protein
VVKFPNTVVSEAMTMSAWTASPQTEDGLDSPSRVWLAAAAKAVRPDALRHRVRRTAAHAPLGPSYSPIRSPAQLEAAESATFV